MMGFVTLGGLGRAELWVGGFVLALTEISVCIMGTCAQNIRRTNRSECSVRSFREHLRAITVKLGRRQLFRVEMMPSCRQIPDYEAPQETLTSAHQAIGL